MTIEITDRCTFTRRLSEKRRERLAWLARKYDFKPLADFDVYYVPARPGVAEDVDDHHSS